ncbi:MAG: 4Fe-4S binding protein [Dissulfurimicrobium sp.]
MPIKRILKIVFDIDPDDRLDLFKAFPVLKTIFKERRLHASIRTFGDIIFTFIILSGLFGPQDPKKNCAIFLSWGVWWPFLVLSWFFIGRMWCGFCPFPGLGRIVQRLGFTFCRPVPKSFEKYGIYWAIGLFAVIIWLEESTGIKDSPRATAFLILFILMGATISSVFFPLQAWCRYLCPMGRMTGAAATFSLIEFRPDHEKCKGCGTFACKRGRDGMRGCPVYLGAFAVRNNLDCLVCGHCVAMCDRDSPRLNLRSPFSELILNKGRFITCSFIIPFLMGSQLARFIFHGFDVEIWCQKTAICNMGIFSSLLIVGFLYAMAFVRIGAHTFGVTEDEVFGRFSPMIPIFVPMAFAGELIYRLNYSLSNAPDFFPALGRQFGIGPLLLLTFYIPEWFFRFIDSFIMASSAVAALYVLYRFANDDFHGMVGRSGYAVTQALIIIMAASYFCVLPIWR